MLSWFRLCGCPISCFNLKFLSILYAYLYNSIYVYVIACIIITKVATERKETKHIEYLQALGVSLIVLGYFLHPVSQATIRSISTGLSISDFTR